MKSKSKRQPVFVLLHNIRSIHNVGSIFRTADALGVEKIFISGYTPTPTDRFDRPRKDLAKVALGAEKTIPWEYLKSPISLIKKCKGEGIISVALEQDERAVDYKKFRQTKPVLFIVGNEVDGVDKGILNTVDTIIEIPMLGEKESLNVSVSFGIALYRISGI